MDFNRELTAVLCQNHMCYIWKWLHSESSVLRINFTTTVTTSRSFSVVVNVADEKNECNAQHGTKHKESRVYYQCRMLSWLRIQNIVWCRTKHTLMSMMENTEVQLYCYSLPHSVFFQYRNVACTAGGPSVAVQLSSPRRRPRHLSTLLTSRSWAALGEAGRDSHVRGG